MSAPPAIGFAHQSERSFQRAVVELAQRLGYRVAHFHDSRRQVAKDVIVGDRDAAGWPDLVVVGHGRMFILELKTATGRLRPAQRAWLQALDVVADATDGRVHVGVYRPKDWPEIVRLLTMRGLV